MLRNQSHARQKGSHGTSRHHWMVRKIPFNFFLCTHYKRFRIDASIPATWIHYWRVAMGDGGIKMRIFLQVFEGKKKTLISPCMGILPSFANRSNLIDVKLTVKYSLETSLPYCIYNFYFLPLYGDTTWRIFRCIFIPRVKIKFAKTYAFGQPTKNPI